MDSAVGAGQSALGSLTGKTGHQVSSVYLLLLILFTLSLFHMSLQHIYLPLRLPHYSILPLVPAHEPAPFMAPALPNFDTELHD